MPELPEVENVRIGLEKELTGNSILSVNVLEDKIISGNGTKRIANKKKTKEFESGVINKKIISVKRRAKNIIINFEDQSLIIIHLKMTGQLIFNKYTPTRNDNKEITNKHTYIIFNLKNGTLLYNDVRKFGYVLYYKNLESAIEEGHFSKLGLEPFDKNFTLNYFQENILKKNKNIKTILLEQSVVVGCGNIYADEICFASKVLPSRNSKTLNEIEIKNLYKNIIKILSVAIRMGGSSISDYKLVNGESGKYANNHKVYGKHNTPCIVCKNNLEKIIISGRSTIFCEFCQK
jgi:formamidopyrimidine-DNA glycosylase